MFSGLTTWSTTVAPALAVLMVTAASAEAPTYQEAADFQIQWCRLVTEDARLTMGARQGGVSMPSMLAIIHAGFEHDSGMQTVSREGVLRAFEAPIADTEAGKQQAITLFSGEATQTCMGF